MRSGRDAAGELLAWLRVNRRCYRDSTYGLAEILRRDYPMLNYRSASRLGPPQDGAVTQPPRTGCEFLTESRRTEDSLGLNMERSA